ncbi:MAG TPA: hypothetical protein VK721_06405 [Solirubrobacteraceae bacterium]|jgi:hypothetical protein|nr:hypothetical protein [Solirubrobacteraceae bacterium]
MTDPQPFTRVLGTTLYWQPESERQVAFQASDATLPDTLTPAASWADAGGVYVFLDAPPERLATKASSDADFAAELLLYLTTLGWPGGPRFLWLANVAEDPYARWSGQPVWAQSVAGAWQVSRLASFDLCGYGLSLAAGSVVTLNDWTFAFSKATSGSPPAASFRAPGGRYPAAGEGAVELELAGPAAGCLALALALPGGGSQPSDFERLEVGVRFFRPEPERPASLTEDTMDGHGDVFVRALALPTIVQPAPRALALEALVDPLRPLDGERTHLSFFPPGTTQAPALGSTFATARGHGVTLTPQAAAGAVPDARLVLAEQPLFTGADGDVPKQLYLTLEGAFALGWELPEPSPADRAGEPDASLNRLLCGASGLEYLGIDSEAQSALVFYAGRPAYASLVDAAEPGAALDPRGTTAWVYPTTTAEAGVVGYYSQPGGAAIYQASEPDAGESRGALGEGFLPSLEQPAIELPATAGQPFPIAPYRGLEAEAVADALELEARAIAPARRRALTTAASSQPSPREPAAALSTARVAVTAQGLGVGIAEDDVNWTWLGIASNRAGTSSEPELRFTAIDPMFRQAMQTNRLFLVMANAAELMRHGSVRYQLTEAGVAALRGSIVPEAVLDQVEAWFEVRSWPSFENEAEFLSKLHEATPSADQYAALFEREAGLLTPSIEGWSFRISPRNWEGPGGAQTIVVFKLAGGLSLRQFTDDVMLWSWPEVAAFPGGTVAQTRLRLRDLYARAEGEFARLDGHEGESPYADFVRLLDDERWTGILAFDCEVPPHTLPEPLHALGGGVDPARFRAHHVGFNVTPVAVTAGAPTFQRTSMFGVIDYDDGEDQYLEPDAATFYAFKVLRLAVAFRNSAIAGFSSQVELLINRMFGAATRLYPTEHGNNVLLDGVYQKRPRPGGGEEGTYVFAAHGDSSFQLEDSALRRVVLRSTQLVTASPPTPSNPDAKVRARFVMAGDLHFYEPPEFDLFGFGYEAPVPPEAVGAAGASGGSGTPAPGPDVSLLRFGNLALDMEFSPSSPQPTFTLSAEALSLDLAASRPRAKSLLACFPVKLAGFLATPDQRQAQQSVLELDLDPATATTPRQRPESLGYVTIGTPLAQSQLADPWYGLVYELDLGTLGALSGSSRLTLKLLAGWSAGGTREQPAVYAGVRLPGVSDALGVSLPLQGALTLGFRSIQMLVSDTDPAHREYILRMRDFALRMLGIALPPGNNDLYLFAKPGQTTSTKLGWYAAYTPGADTAAAQSQSPATRLAAARREPS